MTARTVLVYIWSESNVLERILKEGCEKLQGYQCGKIDLIVEYLCSFVYPESLPSMHYELSNFL